MKPVVISMELTATYDVVLQLPDHWSEEIWDRDVPECFKDALHEWLQGLAVEEFEAQDGAHLYEVAVEYQDWWGEAESNPGVRLPPHLQALLTEEAL